MYDILNKYEGGSPGSDTVDIPFNKASKSDKIAMIALIEPK